MQEPVEDSAVKPIEMTAIQADEIFSKHAGKKAIRLTRNADGKIVKIELYVNDAERRKIFNHFPDKIIGWKEAAPHLVILNSLAAYKKKQLIIENSPKNHQKEIDKLGDLAKALCQHAAPLYALINDSDFDYPSHPANKAWKDFLAENKFCHNKIYLKILFIKAQLTVYRDNVNSQLDLASLTLIKEQLPDLFKLQLGQIDEFIAQLDRLCSRVPDEALLQKLISNQDKVGSSSLISLGEFLRSQAHTLTGDVLAVIDQLSEARFDQLFSFRANPLRKKFACARRVIDDQRSTQAVRFINTRLPIPEGQLAVLDSTGRDLYLMSSFPEENLHLYTSSYILVGETLGYITATGRYEEANLTNPGNFLENIDKINRKNENKLYLSYAQINEFITSNGSHIPPEYAELKWFDIMPYVNCKTFLGSGIEGSEGLDDVDHILEVYANDNDLQPLKKPSFFLYRWLMGEKGAGGVLAVVLFGLPILAVMGVGLIAGACLATAFDFLLFLTQFLLFTAASPLLVVAAAADFVLQIPGFFVEEAAISDSCLKFMATKDIPPASINKFFRQISAIRQFKQFFLDHHKYYCSSQDSSNAQFNCIDVTTNEEAVSKQQILDQIKQDQAESLFNVIASNYFTFATAANFLQRKLGELFYAVRELRKVISMTFEAVEHFFFRQAGRIQTIQRNRVVKRLKTSVTQKHDQLMMQFSKALDPYRNTKNIERTEHKTVYSQRTWPVIAGWMARESPNPFDFFSDIAAGAVGTVDFAFTEDPGIATPMFILAILGMGALLFPSLAGVVPAQIIYGLQWVPQKVAKAFMGKTLQAGLSDVVVNILSNFLQWQLTTYGVKGVIEIYHGNFEWIKKLFDYPEEITLSAATFVSLGYGIGFIPDLPTDAQVFSGSSHPFVNAFINYPVTIYNGFAGAFNVIIDESREVVGHAVSGLNTLELAFIGLKSSLFIYGLLSGTYEGEIQPLHINFENLCRDYFAAEEIERLIIIQTLLKAYKITDPETKLAKQICDELSQLANNQTDLIDSANLQQQDSVSFDEEMSSEQKQQENLDPTKKFLDTRKHLNKLLTSIEELEVLGMSIDLLDNQQLIDESKQESEGKLTNSDQDEQYTGYQSKLNAELIYDALFFAIEDYNQAAKELGLFHQQIDGSDLLHNFYNKHCYTGNSGWQKIVFGLLLFPVTWVWRGFKYLVGTPSMRHQVKKSFCEDFAMLFQLIPDVIAPVLRSFLKATLYAIRMALGVLLLPVLALAIGIMVAASVLALVGIIPVSLYALVEGVRADSAKTFSACMATYFNRVKQFNQAVWQALLCNDGVNTYLKWITFIGGTMGTGSPHRVNLLKILGLASCYEYLTAIADNHYEALPVNIRQLNIKLAGDGKDIVAREKDIKLTPVQNAVLTALKNYQEEAESRLLKPVSEERPRQVAYLSDHLFSGRASDSVIDTIITSLNADPDSKLAQELKEQGAYSAGSPLLVN